MEHNETFKMTYSAQQQEEIHQIRKKYIPQEPDKMAQLRALDAGATKKASRYAIITGVIGTLIMGAGMSLIMSDFGTLLGTKSFPVGMIIGVIGIIVLGFAYPLFHYTLKKERERIAPDILRLTEELMQ